MFYLDGISLYKIKDELKKILLNRKTTKFSSLTNDTIAIYFNKIRLILSCGSNLSILYIDEGKEAPSEVIALNFISTLRKYLMSAILMDINQLGFDRILVFNFERINEIGEKKAYKLYFEIMGKHSNILLVDSKNIIIDSLKKFSLDENKLREIFPGIPYVVPIIYKKKSPKDLTKEEFDKYINLDQNLDESLSSTHLNYKNNKPEDLKKDITETIVREIEGIGKLLASNINNFEDLQKILDAPLKPRIYFKNNEIILATVLDIKPINYDSYEEFESFTAMFNFYLIRKKLSSAFLSLRTILVNVTNKKIKKFKKIKTIILKELEENKNYNLLKEKADILSASIYKLKKGDTSVELFNFFNNESITIELNPLLTPVENLNKLYKSYQKLKRNIKFNNQRLIEIEENIDYFESILLFIESSKSLENLESIKQELTDLGYIKINTKQKRQKKKKEIGYGVLDNEFESKEGNITTENIKDKNIEEKNIEEKNIEEKNIEDKNIEDKNIEDKNIENNESFQILYGRNNIENDNLTFKIANKNDIWLHAKNVPGAHVIIKGNNITDEILLKAAKIAAFFSKTNIGDKVTVDYTLKKHVTKPKNSNLGFVTYVNEKSIIVEKIDLNL